MLGENRLRAFWNWVSAGRTFVSDVLHDMSKKILKIIFCGLKIFDSGAPDDLYLWLICADQRATKLLAANADTRCLGLF